MTPWRMLARIGAMAFFAWLVISWLIASGVLKLGFRLDVAALVGIPTPPLIALLLS